MTFQFLLALLGILWVDLLLSGDNALVIAMATRKLPLKQQRLALFGGVGVAVALRLIGAVFAGYLMGIPLLAAAGGVALLYIAYKLVAAGDEDHDVKASTGLMGAIATIGVADASMSLDNVIAVAGLSHGDNLLMAAGILLSIPMVIFGSMAISWLLTKLPVLVWAGAGLLGWVAGDIIAKDHFVEQLAGGEYISLVLAAPLVGAVLVLVAGAAARVLTKPVPSPLTDEPIVLGPVITA